MRKYIPVAVVAVLLLTLTSCKKSFLEIVPKQKLIATTYDDYNTLMNGSQLYLYYYGGLWEPAALMGDEVGAEEAFFTANEVSRLALDLFQWKDDIFLQTSNATDGNPLFLSACLRNVYTCNKIINEVLSATGGTTEQKQGVQAEARCRRAFAYFQLINYFGKPYDAATAAADPGFPIVTATDITASHFTRNSVQEVYDFIINDLTGAIPHLQEQVPVATRISKAAAEGLLGKVYLFMGNNTAALAQFNAAFDGIAHMTAPPRLYDYNVEFAPGGSFLPVSNKTGPNSPFNNVTDLTESVLATMSYQGNYNGNGFGNDFLVLTPETAALYDAADWRLQFYSPTYPNRQPNPSGRLRKYGVNYSRIGLELPELYLLRAESEARANDLPGAVSDVETLRMRRMPAAQAPVPGAIATDQNALIKFIIDERTREFAATGYRWWDMRRLSTDPLFAGQPAAVHSLFLTAGGATEYTLKPERLTLRIPQYYIATNPGMTDNP